MDKHLIDKLLADYKSPEELVGENGLLRQLTKVIVERAVQAGLTTHLRSEKHSPEEYTNGNRRSRIRTRLLKGEFGTGEIEAPPHRQSSRKLKPVSNAETRFAVLDNEIRLLYAQGLTAREIQAQLEEMYRLEVSRALISNMTDTVIEEGKAWQRRPLDAVYPLVYLDAVGLKMHDQGRIESRAVHIAIGITLGGQKQVLGLWISADEGPKFWLQLLTELRNRGVKDIFVVCVDGLKGFRRAVQTVYPKTSVQLCIVHLVRTSLNYVSWKERRLVARNLELIYRASGLEEAERQLANFARHWDKRYPSVSALWRRNWVRFVPLFRFSPEIRKIICTTNPLESLNMRLRDRIDMHVAFPNEEAAMKVIYLTLRNLNIKRTAVHGWKEALNHFSILWESRFPQNIL